MGTWINRPTREWHLERIRSTGATVAAACGTTWHASMIDPRQRIDDMALISVRSRCKECHAIARLDGHD